MSDGWEEKQEAEIEKIEKRIDETTYERISDVIRDCCEFLSFYLDYDLNAFNQGYGAFYQNEYPEEELYEALILIRFFRVGFTDSELEAIANNDPTLKIRDDNDWIRYHKGKEETDEYEIIHANIFSKALIEADKWYNSKMKNKTGYKKIDL
jgi:hypothetical protein|tara:strand:+ start:44 stop:499 length:456 start_codon:yes stop_codon:yes gene_type:complete